MDAACEAASNRPGGWLDALRPRVAVLLLAGFVLVVFLPSLAGEFVWDDHQLIQHNSLLRSADQLGEALSSDFWHVSDTDDLPTSRNRYYRPVVTLAYFAQYQCFGDASWGYHAVSVILHLACVLLVFGWLRRRLGSAPSTVLAAFAGAVVFALHPSRAESVAWISGSTDLWMTLFVLLGLTAWDRLRGAAAVVGAAAAFGMACLAKETAVVVPALLLADVWLLPGEVEDRCPRLIRAGCVAVAVWAAFGLRLLLMPPVAAAAGIIEGLVGVFERVAATMGHYLSLVVWPWGTTVSQACQTFDDDGNLHYASWAIALGVVALLAIAASFVVAVRRRTNRRQLADLLWLVVPLAPALNAVPLRLTSLVSNRFLYLPLLGLALLVGRGVLRSRTPGRLVRRLALAALGLVAVAWTGETVIQVASFRNDEAVWTRASEADPRDVCAARGLADLRIRQARFEEAVQLLVRTGELDGSRPAYEQTLLLFAVQAALGATPDANPDVLHHVRRFYDDLASGVTAQFDVAGLRLQVPGSPETAAQAQANIANFRVPRAVAHARTGDLRGAEMLLRESMMVAPRSAVVRAWLAHIQAWQERWADALGTLEHARRLGLSSTLLDVVQREIETSVRRLQMPDARHPIRHALVVAEALLGLQAPGLARRALLPVFRQDPIDLEVARLLVVADVFDGSYDLAREVVAEARRRDPARGALWDELHRDLEEAVRLSAGRRRVGEGSR